MGLILLGCALPRLSRCSLFVRARGPPAIPLFGGPPSLVRRPPSPLFTVTGLSSERQNGLS